jgi:hypothetical protein
VLVRLRPWDTLDRINRIYRINELEGQTEAYPASKLEGQAGACPAKVFPNPVNPVEVFLRVPVVIGYIKSNDIRTLICYMANTFVVLIRTDPGDFSVAGFYFLNRRQRNGFKDAKNRKNQGQEA